MSLKLNERYPGRFNNPSADYPGGSFKNRTSPVAKDGSYLEQDWANDKEGLFQSLLRWAGVTPNGLVDKVGSSQYYDALLSLLQSQAGQVFTAGGTSTALTLTPTPAITAYAQGQKFCVRFISSSGANPTISISGLIARAIKQYDSTGAKVSAVFAADQMSNILYDGADFVMVDPLPASVIFDPWAAQPIGVPIPLFDYIAGVQQPPLNKSYRYVTLTASDSYNTGALGSEAVAGSAPLVAATAIITLADSPLLGRSIDLINTEQRVLRAGPISGQLLQDSLQNITGSTGNNIGAFDTDQSGAFANATPASNRSSPSVSGSYAGTLSFDASRVARTSNETRAKSISATYFMRIR